MNEEIENKESKRMGFVVYLVSNWRAGLSMGFEGERWREVVEPKINK